MTGSAEVSLAARSVRDLGLLATVLAVGATVILVLSGVPAVETIRIVAVVAVQCLAGVVVWRRLDPSAGAVLVLGMGLALGSALAVVAGLVVQVLGMGSWGWALPGLVAAIAIVVSRPWRRRPASAREPLDRPTVFALIAAAIVGLGILAYTWRGYPLTWTGSWSGYHVDMPFFEALATSLARLGPLDSIFVPGGEIRYHWLVYAWAGQVTEAAGAGPFVVMTRAIPIVAVVAGSLLVTGWARRLSRVDWVPTVAAALLLVGGHLGALYGGVLPQDSPSQAVSAVWLLALAVALVTLLGRSAGSARWTLLAVVAVLGFATMGGKVSAGAPAIAGAVLVAAVAQLRRESWRLDAVLGATAIVVSGVAAFVLLISGSAGGGGLGLLSLLDKSSSQQGMNPTEGAIGVLAGTAVMLVAVAARWAGVAWLVAEPRWRWRPETVFAVGLAGASLTAIVVLSGFNEIWFSAASSAPLAVMTAVGAGEACRRACNDEPRRERRVVAGAVAAALLITVVVWALWATGASGGNVWTSTWRWAAPLVAVGLALLAGAGLARWGSGAVRLPAALGAFVVVLVFATVPGRLLGVGTGQIGILQPGFRGEWFTAAAEVVSGRDVTYVDDWTDSQMRAAAWLRANAAPTDLLATNLTFSPFVPAVTGLPTYVSGIRYQAPYGRPGLTSVLLDHDARTFAFLESPSTSTVAPLCEAGVRWLWVDPRTFPGQTWLPWAAPVVTEPDAVVLRLDAASCPPGQA